MMSIQISAEIDIAGKLATNQLVNIKPNVFFVIEMNPSSDRAFDRGKICSSQS